jgi:hypothetical protein
LVVVTVAAFFLVSGCSGGVDGPVIEGNRSTGGTDAEVLGVVAIEGDCIFLSQAETATRYPVVWPHGTSWNGAESAIELPDGTLVHAGNRLYGGGGYYTGANLDGYTVAEGVELALRCVDNEYGEVAVFNSVADIDVEQ